MLLAAPLAVAGIGATTIVSPATALAYSCPGVNHCYGRNGWTAGLFQVWHGAGTGVTVVHLYCTYCGTVGGGETGFVDNEMWFGDDNCTAADYSPCEVEVGYSTYTDPSLNTTVQYFWADDTQSNGYSEHTFAVVPSGDYGNDVFMYIEPDGSSSWDVSVSSPNYYGYAISQNNPMSPGHVLVGQELAGSSGQDAYAPYAYFTSNEYADSSNNWHYFNWDGSLQYNNPPWVGYQQRPSQSSSGGSIFTNCC